VGFASKARAAIAAGASLDVDSRAIVEHVEHRDSHDPRRAAEIVYDCASSDPQPHHPRREPA
jgi:hypothetical protein